MKRLAAMAILLTVILGARPGVAEAQEREGFWAAVGAGWGSASVSSDETGAADRQSSGVGYVELGGTLNEHLLLGGEFNLWRKTAALATNVNGALKVYNLDATLTYYPAAKGGFFLKGGAGVSLLDAELIGPSGTLKLDLGSGLGVIVGLGYDIPISRNVSLTPALNYWGGRLGDLQFGSQTSFKNWRQNVVDLTIGITVH